ncbi:MAG: hypothetical protein OEN20_05135 [Gammaproteobacteria bacterium]|nr:hypothetical protein [Gammaproteobacteria bacterium]
MRKCKLEVGECRSDRLSLREQTDWRQLSRRRREASAPPGADESRFEVERVNRHGIVGVHLLSRIS